MSKKTLHYVIHSCGPQECDCSAVCNPREGDEIQATTDASKVTCGNCLRVMAKRKVPLASDQVARLQGPKSICDALQQQVKALEAKNQHQLEEINILNGQLDKFRSQSHGIPALAEIERLRAALHSCAKASSAAEVDLIVDGAIAANQAQLALAPENQRVVPVEPLLAKPHPFEAMRKRFSVIEDEVARGKHNAMSCFTAMRTAALYTDPQPAQVNRIPALDEHLRFILGRPNFWCHHLANALRAMGQEIARKAEEEQAAVIHWLLKAYFEHGPGWREAVEKILAAEREKELAKGSDK